MSHTEKTVHPGLTYVQDIKLAATLVTLGFPLREKLPLERISKNGKPPITLFWFQESDELKNFILAWNEPKDSFDAMGEQPSHPLSNPDHTFWYMRTALRNRERLLDFMHNSKILHVVDKGGKTYLVTTDPK